MSERDSGARIVERDWDSDFDLEAWQALDRGWRKAWLDEAMRRERDGRGAGDKRRQRYERGQTAWDVGLDPLTFDIDLATAIDRVKPEHWDGVIFGGLDRRHQVLGALLANAGLRRTVRLAPRAVWEQALEARAADVSWERALASDPGADTRTATYEPAPTPLPMMRPEFVSSANTA